MAPETQLALEILIASLCAPGAGRADGLSN